MQSYFHYISYFMGFGLSIMYIQFLKSSENNKEGGDLQQNSTESRSMHLFTLIRENSNLRYLMYVIGTILIIGTVSWMYPFMNDPASQ